MLNVCKDLNCQRFLKLAKTQTNILNFCSEFFLIKIFLFFPKIHQKKRFVSSLIPPIKYLSATQNFSNQ